MIARRDALAQVKARVEWADKHFKEFGEMESAFFSTHPYSVFFEEDINSGQKVQHVFNAQPVPVEFSLLIGDILHNLRSALDLLACQLVKLNAPSHNCSWVEFPIAETSQQFIRKFALGKKRQIGLAGNSVLEKLKGLNAYRRGKGRLYWQLNALNRKDKHRLLVVATMLHHGDSVYWFRHTEKGFEEGWSGIEPVILKAGEKIPPPSIPSDVDEGNYKYFYGDSFIAFNEPKIVGREIVGNIVYQFMSLVSSTITLFETDFPIIHRLPLQ